MSVFKQKSEIFVFNLVLCLIKRKNQKNLQKSMPSIDFPAACCFRDFWIYFKLAEGLHSIHYLQVFEHWNLKNG